jgi:class 3 adenylate cyclase/tetratricopeptide (TPR) repeat protein
VGNPDLTAYSPRLLLQWEEQDAAARHRTIEGTLVFADVSGFTRLSERLARTRGKAGAEELTDTISILFGSLLTVAARRGGEMLKYGGDAVLLFFRGDDHELRATAAAWEMQARLREIGRVETDAGAVRLRMSVGVASGGVDLFKVGRRHRELVVAGPVTTETARVETAAQAGEILLSPRTAAALPPACLGLDRDGDRLLRRCPTAPTVPIVAATPSSRAADFVSEALRSHLAGDVDPEHRLATVAFVHLMGIDGMLATGDADAVAARLDDSLATVQDSLAEYGVTFLATDLAADGTKVMAAAGAPFTGDDDERCMLLALRRMVEAGAPLPIRAGAHRGHVFAAAVGPSFRRTYTTMGDVTNTAARVMSRAAPGEVLVLADVVEHARGRFAVAQLDPFIAKGKREPLVPLRVEGAAEDVVSTRSTLPLVGRDVELGCLLAAAEAALEGTGSVVEVVADMGAGKSRLIDELISQTAAPVHVVHCEPYERSTPFHPVRRLVSGLVDGSLERVVQERAPHLRPWVPLIANVLDVEVTDTPEAAALDARVRLKRTAEATVELLSALHPGPAVLVIEDVHWLDDASAAVLRALEQAVTSRPWVLCVTRRDEPSTFTPSASTELVHLAPLGIDDMHALVRAATPDAPLPPHRRDELVARAAGNPLYLNELLVTAGSGDALPSSVEAVLAAQIDRLPPADRTLLRQASVLGTRFPLSLLAELTGDDSLLRTTPVKLARRLDSLVVPVDDERVRFRHQLVRDVAYESLPFRQRRTMHAVAAAAIERSTQDPSERAGILSLHYMNARDDDRTWRFARMAADRACSKHAMVEGVALIQRALDAAQRIDVAADERSAAWEMLAGIQRSLGDGAASKAALRQARRFAADRPADLARLCQKEARIREWEANTKSLIRWVQRGLRVLHDLDDVGSRRERAELLVLLAWAKQYQGRPLVAKRLAEEAIREAEASQNRYAIAGAILAMNGADVALGLPTDTKRSYRALEIYEELGMLYEQGLVLTNMGSHAASECRWRESLDLSARAREVLRRCGNLVEGAYGTLNMAEVLIDQGRVDEAEPLLDEAEETWRSIGHSLGAAYCDGHRGRIQLLRDDIDGATALFERARQVYEHDGLATFVLDIDARLFECRLRKGDVTGARAGAQAALAQDRAAGGTRTGATLHRIIGCAAAAQGEPETATASFGQSIEIARRRQDPLNVILALDCMVALGIGDVGASANERDTIAADLGIVAAPRPPVTLLAAS